MVKVIRKTGLSGLYSTIKQKFNIDQPYTLSYQDSEGDNINLDDDDDLEIFLDSPDTKKIIHINFQDEGISLSISPPENINK